MKVSEIEQAIKDQDIRWGDKVELTYKSKAEDGTESEQTQTVVFRQFRNDTEDDPSTPMIVRHSLPRGRKRTHTAAKDIVSIKNTVVRAKAEEPEAAPVG